MSAREVLRLGRRPRGRLMTMEFGPRRRPGPRRLPRPKVAPGAKCIAPLRIDGGTAFGCFAPIERWHPQLLAMVREYQRAFEDPAELDALRRKPPLVSMPMPPLPGQHQRGLAGVLEETAIDYRLLGFGSHDGPPLALVMLRGPRHIVFHFPDRAYVSVSERLDSSTGEIGWYVRVEAKHRELYAEGEVQWMTRWLGLWSWLTLGEWVGPRKLRASGWSITQLHINSDFTGIEFDREDESDFVAARKRSAQGHACDDLEDYPLDAWQSPWVQTLTVGRKASDIAICIYRKGDQLREEKRLMPESSAYAPTWVANGWCGSAIDGDPVRVEFRLRKKALQLVRAEDDTDDELAYDWRDPALLLDSAARRHLWRHVTQARRLVARDVDCPRCDGRGCEACGGRGQHTISRLRRAPTDPRWQLVERAADYKPPFDLRQIRHAVAELTRGERQHRAWRALAMAAKQVAGLDENIALPHTRENLAAYLEHLAGRLRAGGNEVVAFESNDFIPAQFDRGTDVVAQRCGLFVGELVDEPRTDAALRHLEELGARGVGRLFEFEAEGGDDADGTDGTGPPDPPCPPAPNLDAGRRRTA